MSSDSVTCETCGCTVGTLHGVWVDRLGRLCEECHTALEGEL
jgi:hypothetical protein